MRHVCGVAVVFLTVAPLPVRPCSACSATSASHIYDDVCKCFVCLRMVYDVHICLYSTDLCTAIRGCTLRGEASWCWFFDVQREEEERARSATSRLAAQKLVLYLHACTHSK